MPGTKLSKSPHVSPFQVSPGTHPSPDSIQTRANASLILRSPQFAIYTSLESLPPPTCHAAININMLACERCHSRKTKCDRRQPRCTACTKSQASCRYPNKRRDRLFQQEHLRSVELRLNELECENRRLRERVDAQVQSATRQDECADSSPSVPRTQSTNDQHSPTTNGQGPSEAQQQQLQSPTQRRLSSHQRTPDEETRYLGSSNGVDFVDVVERVVESSHSGGLFGRLTDSHRIGDRDRVALPHVAQPAALVDQAMAMPLINTYFEHWHLTFPLLHRPAFMQMVHGMYSDPGVYHRDAAYAFAFDIVLALGAVPSKRGEWGFSDMETHFARALIHLDEVSALRDIRSLQALLLYCKYSIHASLRDTSSEMWEVLGRATRLVIELGLHQKSSTNLPRCETHITGSLPESVRAEMSRRTFWCYYNLER